MPISLPNLDDRTYADLVEEARALIPTYAPDEWTNHNASDPGITLIEMFAYLTEMLMYRLNRVTDANVCAFLKLIEPERDGEVVDRRPVGDGWIEETHKTTGRVERVKLSEATRRVVLALRKPDRAVTAEDYERLVLEGFPDRVSRVRSVGDRNLESEDPDSRGVYRPGHVSLMLVPAVGPGVARPAPDDQLIQDVLTYLEPRRLLATRLHAVAPRYLEVGVRVTLFLKRDWRSDDVGPKAIRELRRFFDPVEGWKDGGGWPFGRNVYVSEIYELLDRLEGVDYVQRSTDPDTDEPLEEVIAADSKRLIRTSSGALVGVELLPDELVDLRIDDYKSEITEKTVSITTALEPSA
ncbi:MAG TPA: baseplate J/gp47 family protein [Blastocatellia bacterium]|nr:baseplate J/gp47 family protein [Blastocatellia bacterium]